MVITMCALGQLNPGTSLEETVMLCQNIIRLAEDFTNDGSCVVRLMWNGTIPTLVNKSSRVEEVKVDIDRKMYFDVSDRHDMLKELLQEQGIYVAKEDDVE